MHFRQADRQAMTSLAAKHGAHDQIRTGDLVLTKNALYRLSYVGQTLLPGLETYETCSATGLVGGGAGFEPANPFREPDLQTGAINHSATPPNGADEGTRTLNLRFTKPLLCQLSYVGEQSPSGPFDKKDPPFGGPSGRCWNIPEPQWAVNSWTRRRAIIRRIMEPLEAFETLDVRVGRILRAEPNEKAP